MGGAVQREGEDVGCLVIEDLGDLGSLSVEVKEGADGNLEEFIAAVHYNGAIIAERRYHTSTTPDAYPPLMQLLGMQVMLQMKGFKKACEYWMDDTGQATVQAGDLLDWLFSNYREKQSGDA